MSGESFAALSDVLALTGATYTPAEQERITALLPLVSDQLRVEAEKVGKNLDEMAEQSTPYASLLKTTVVDVVARVLRQRSEGEAMVQESQSGLGYTWSGTYAVPGGGIAGAVMNNDLKRLGLKRQQVKVVDLYEQDSRRDGDAH
jgi:hypothetical protein